MKSNKDFGKTNDMGNKDKQQSTTNKGFNTNKGFDKNTTNKGGFGGGSSGNFGDKQTNK